MQGARRKGSDMANRRKRRAPASRKKAEPRRKPARARASRPPLRPHHHPELWGLAFVATGLVLAAILWLSWEGGFAGEYATEWLDDLLGAAAVLVPAVLCGLGALMLVRSALVSVTPFRAGLGVSVVGLLIVLGTAHGGLAGEAFGGGVARVVGGTGAVIIGIAVLLGGALLLTGASAGAILRRSGTAVRAASVRAGSAARRTMDGLEWDDTAETVSQPEPPVARRTSIMPVDGVEAYPDVLATQPPAMLAAHSAEDVTIGDEPEKEGFEPIVSGTAYRLPDRSVLKESPPVRADSGETSARTAKLLVETLAHFGVEATIIGQIAGPRVVRYELQLAPGTKVSKVAALKDDLSYALATTEIRILAPIPGKQAVGVEVPNLSPRLVTLGDIFDDLPGDGEPAARCGSARTSRGNAVWTDLARMPHLLIAGTTGSGKSGCINTLLTSILLRATPDEVRHDPDRPEADRAQLLRVDPAPADAGRLEPEGGVGGAPERRRRDGAPLRAALDHPRAQPPRGEPRVPRARGGSAAVPARRDRRARRPDDGLAAGRGGRDHPPRPEVARRRHPPRARDAAAVGRRDHRDDQGERPVPHRLRGLEPDRLARDPRRARAPRACSARATCSSSRSAPRACSASRART